MNSESPIPLVDLSDPEPEPEPEPSKARADDDSRPEEIRMGSTSNSESSGEIEKPILRVSFRDFEASSLFRPKLTSFLTDLDTEGNNRISYDFENHILELWDDVKAEDGSREKKKQELTTDDTDSSFFVIDTCPKVSDDLDIPTYKKKYDQILEKVSCGSPKPAAEDRKPEDTGPKLTCFNCTGNHNLRDCTEPKNYANISKNRKDFMNKQGPKNVRYHVDEDQKFGRFVPGLLSDNLRNALGLRHGELPKHIYRMRTLGYPPGWLEEARLQHSGISLFNSEGMEVVDQEAEIGEIEEDGDKDRYDIKKIYDFPGFNVPPPPGTRDSCYWALESQLYHSKEAMLTMLSSKKADEGYKRKKLKTIHDSSDLNAGVGEMEIEILEESVVESLPVNGSEIEEIILDSSSSPASKKPDHPEKTRDDSSCPSAATVDAAAPPSIAAAGGSETAGTTEDSQDSQVPEDPRTPESESMNVSTASSPSRANSPSLSDLESRKKQLLAELDDTSSPSNPDTGQMPPPATISTPIGTRTIMNANAPSSGSSGGGTSGSNGNNSSNNGNNGVSGDDVPKVTGAPTTTTSTTTTSTTTTPTTTRGPGSGQNNHPQGTVKSVDLGTPILQSTSPYRKLPSSEKFSKDICDVINFENLPDATGKYERMTGIIQKVRDTLTRIHQE